MKKILTSLLLVAASFAIPAPALAKWETLRTERTDVRQIAKDSDIEIKAAKGVIQITTSRAQHVKIYTILGRLVSAETIPAGTSQFLIKAHGVYIVKAGDLTCKVAL